MVEALGTREANEALLLAAARQGDHEAFTSLTEPYRSELLVYGYRLLGSFQDAEDLIQETLLRAWTRLASFAGRSTFRAWLYKIATNTGLNVLAHASRRSLPVRASSPPDPAEATSYQAPGAEPHWLEPILESYVDAAASSPEAVYSLRESVSLAFMVALHALPPHQRVTLILRDVLDWHAAEVAEFLDISVPAVNSALQRARATLARQYHPIGLDAIETPALTPALQTLLDRYMQAWATSDVDALINLLKEDATFAMPPQPPGMTDETPSGSSSWRPSSLWAGRFCGAWNLLRRMPSRRVCCIASTSQLARSPILACSSSPSMVTRSPLLLPSSIPR
jgi:RNA polymerase sigma-70 factor (ECF subfamily)